MKRPTAILSLGITCLLLLAAPCSAVTAKRGPVAKADKVLDENAIFIENEYLELGITTNSYAGQVMSLLYKPTGQELCAEKHPQGYCKDRMGQDRYFWKTKSEGYNGEVLSQSEEKAEAKVTYLWNYNYHGIQTRIQVAKTYTLKKGASAIEVLWWLKNVGDQEAPVNPWVKHLGGQYERLLAGPTWMLFEDGARDPGGDFVNPAVDWVARLSGTENSEEFPMVCSVMDFRKTYQQFPWRGKYRFTLETILNRAVLKPGDTWELTYVLCAMPNLGNPLYAAPELAASIVPEGIPPAPGKECTVTVHLSPAMDLGEKRLEGQVTSLEGEMVAKLPNRQVTLTPGKISSVSYAFTPPENGAYTFSLTVFDRQQILRLGQTVNSQRPSITLPLVVGPKPEKIMQKWESSEVGWPVREEREVKPLRTLVSSEPMKVAQIRVPERIYPEDRIVYSVAAAPAAIRVARGEYEDLQFVVDFGPQEDVLAMEVTADPLVNDRGEQLAHAELYEAIYLTTTTPSGYGNFPVGDWPDPLFENGWIAQIPDAPIAKRNVEILRKAKRRVFWYIVKVPIEAAPGTYRTQVHLALGRDRKQSFPVEITVETFALPKRPSFRPSTGLVGCGKFESNFTLMGWPKERIDKFMRDKETGESSIDRVWQKCLEYGWTPTMWGGPKMWEKYHDHGRGMTVFTGGANPEAEKWLKERGLLKYSFVYAPFDEHADVLVPKVAEWCRKFKAEHETPILDCFYGSNVKPLFGLVDVWLGQSPRQEWAKERKKHGDQFLSCNSSLVWHVEFDPISGRAAFWDDFVSGVDGRYVYSSVRWTPDVYKKNWSSGNYMGCAIYPGPNGLTTSLRWETMRDGVEDYDYLAVLRSVAQAKQKAGAGKDEALKEAMEILEAEDLASKVRTVDGLHQMRERIANLIGKLTSGP